MHFQFRRILWVLPLLVSSLSEASPVTQFNHYQWNRQNHLAGNPQIDRKPWYEWWYFKVVLPETGDSFYSVYGVVNPWDEKRTLKGTRSYVGFGDFRKKANSEENFPISEFHSSYDSTDVSVGQSNRATDRHFEGSLLDPVFGKQAWSIDISRRWEFNAMGIGMFIRGLTNIAWFPAQADAVCSGWVLSDGIRKDFKNAPCYQDRNWGTSFPDWWAWIVSNKFNEDADTAVVVGGGLPEILGRKIFSGVSVGLRFRGKTYSFRPQDLDQVHCEIKWGKWKVQAQNASLRIEIEATAPEDQFMDLQFVTPNGSIFHDYETLTGKLTLKIIELNEHNRTTLLTSDSAGIEYGSENVHELLREISTTRVQIEQ